MDQLLIHPSLDSKALATSLEIIIPYTCIIKYNRQIDTGNRCNSALLAYLGFCGVVPAFKGLEISFTRKHQFIRGAVHKHECWRKKKCDRAALSMQHQKKQLSSCVLIFHMVRQN